MNQTIELLYVEDDLIDEKGLLRTVREKDLPYHVTIARTIADARQEIASHEFDIILTDYHLPDGKGSDLFEDIHGIPLVLITGSLEEELALRTLERGADDYLAKDPLHRHLYAIPSTVEKTLYRKKIREHEEILARELAESERRFRLLLESVKDYAIYMLDLEGRITSWNPGAEHILGWREEEIVGRHFSEFFLPEDLAIGKPQRELEQVRQLGSYEEEARRCRKDGSAFWADVTANVVRDDQGKFCGFGEVMRDVTRFKSVEQKNAELAADLQLALNAAQLGTWNWDLQTDSLIWSDQCLALFGLPPGEPMSYTRFLHALHPEDRQKMDEAVSQALEMRTLYRLKMRTIWPDGTLHWVCSVGRAYYDSKGKATRMAGVAFAVSPGGFLPTGAVDES
jgi:PAS domain S-box-containing protein